MTKKKSLTAALSEPPPTVPAPAEVPAGDPPPRSAPTAPRSDRAGKTNITGYFDKPVKWELQDLATERSRALCRKVTAQELLAEALNDLFKKYGKPEIVPREFQDVL
jgi:hypothetical protein